MLTSAYTSSYILSNTSMQNPTVTSTGIGVGTVFRQTPASQSGGAWTEQVLYRFQGMPDDIFYSQEGVIFGPDGALYDTGRGGSSGWGVLFKLTRPATAGDEWTEKLIYNFQGGPRRFWTGEPEFWRRGRALRHNWRRRHVDRRRRRCALRHDL